MFALLSKNMQYYVINQMQHKDVKITAKINYVYSVIICVVQKYP